MNIKCKKITIKLPIADECLHKITSLIYWSAIKSFVSYICIAFALSLILHLAWPDADNSLSFYFIGLAIFYLFATGFYVLARAYLDIKEYSSKSEQFIVDMYIELVKTGDIKPILAEKSN